MAISSDKRPRPDPTDEAPDPLIGQVIADKYVIETLVGRGGMGRIYRAEQRPLGRIVAFKTLVPHRKPEVRARFERRFLREAATLGKLRHPNTVTIYDYGHLHDVDLYYMVMEFVDGITLARAIATQSPMPAVRVLRIAFEIARALSEAHATGIVHRDLKPGNVMLTATPEGEGVKVLDFGIVKLMNEEDADGPHITREDQVLGSPGYMAPEQILNRQLDGRSDLYSLGLLMYEMMTATNPFRRGSSAETFAANLTEPIPPMPKVLGRPVPLVVSTIIGCLLEKEPEKRFVDADQLKNAIRDALAAMGATDTMPSTVSEVSLVPGHVPESSVPTIVPEESFPAKRRLGLGAVVLGGLALGVVAAVLVVVGVSLVGFLWPSAPPLEETPIAQSPPEPAAPRRLTLRSDPTGAAIFEGDSSIGTTPLEIPITEARTFQLRHEGFEPYTVDQGAITSDMEVVAVLRPVAPVVPPPETKVKSTKSGNSSSSDPTLRPHR